jgi:hypothetical protein
MLVASAETARRLCARPAWIRGIDHRMETGMLGARDLTRSPSTRYAGARAGVSAGAVDVALTPDVHVKDTSGQADPAAKHGTGNTPSRDLASQNNDASPEMKPLIIPGKTDGIPVATATLHASDQQSSSSISSESVVPPTNLQASVLQQSENESSLVARVEPVITPIRVEPVIAPITTPVEPAITPIRAEAAITPIITREEPVMPPITASTQSHGAAAETVSTHHTIVTQNVSSNQESSTEPVLASTALPFNANMLQLAAGKLKKTTVPTDAKKKTAQGSGWLAEALRNRRQFIERDSDDDTSDDSDDDKSDDFDW